MGLENLRFWHWMVIGLLLGSLVGMTRKFYGPGYIDSELQSQVQVSFEQQLLGRPSGRQAALVQQFHANEPLLKDMVVHPPLESMAGRDGPSPTSYWITGKAYNIARVRENPKDPKSKIMVEVKWEPFIYEAKVPYVPMLPDSNPTYPTVIEYLRAQQKSVKIPFTFRLAWWDHTMAMVGLPTAAGFVLIGLIWPITLRILSGAGLAPAPREKAAKLPKPKKKAAPSPDRAAANADDQKKLDELNAELEAGLGNFAMTEPSKADSLEDELPANTRPATPRPLSPGTPLTTPQLVPADDEPKEYGGEFYPVAKPVHHEKKD